MVQNAPRGDRRLPDLRRWVRTAAAAWGLGALALSGVSEPVAPPSEPKGGKRLRVVAAVYEPFAFPEGGRPQGLDVDLLSLVCAANGWEYQVEWVKFSEVFDRLRAGSADLAIGALYATPERSREFPLTRPYLKTGLVMVVPAESGVRSMRDLRGKRVLVKRGATGEAMAEAMLGPGRLGSYTAQETTEACFEAVRRGEADVVLNDYLNSVFLLSGRYSGQLAIVRGLWGPDFLAENRLAFPFRPGMEKTRDAFDEALSGLKKGGVLERVRRKWIAVPEPVDWRRTLLWGAMVAGILAIQLWLIAFAYTRKLRLDAAVREEAQTRSIIERAPQAIALIKGDRLWLVNEAFARLFGFPKPDTLVGRPLGRVNGSQGEADTMDSVLLRGFKDEVFEARCRRADGANLWVRVKTSRLAEDRGGSVLMVLEDETDRKRAEEALGRSREDYRLLVENQSDLVVKTGVDGRFLFVSPTYCELFGMREADLLGKAYMPLVHEEDRPATAEAWEALFRPPHTAHVEQRALTSRGWRWLAWSSRGVLDEAGAVVAVVGVGRDVTERKAAEELAERTSRRFRSLIENILDVTFILGSGGLVVYVSPSVTRATGYSAEEIMGRSLSEFAPSGNRSALEEALQRATSSPGVTIPAFSFGLRVKSGEIRTFSALTVDLRHDEAVGGIVVTCRDVTEEERAEQAVRESERRFRLLVENVNELIYYNAITQDPPSLQPRYASPRVETILGYGQDEFLGKPSLWLECAHPEDRDLLVGLMADLLARPSERVVEYRFRHKATGEYRWLEDRIVPDLGESGTLRGFFGVVRDVSERKRGESAMRARNRELLALLASAQAMEGFPDVGAAATSICGACLDAFGLELCWIGVVRPETTEIAVLGSAGRDEGYTRQVKVRWDESARAQGPVGRAIKTRMPCVMDVMDPDFAPWKDAALVRGFRTVCAVPLIHEDTVRGALALYSGSEEAFGAGGTEVLEIFARQAAMTVVNASLYDEARRTIHDLQALNEALLKSQEALAESEARFRDMAERTSDIVWEVDGELKYTYLNPVFESISGYAPAEFLNRPVSESLAESDRDGAAKIMASLSSLPGPFGPVEFRARKKGGEVVMIEARGVPRWDAQGRFAGYRGISREVTERKRAEVDLKAAVRRYSRLLENARGILLVWDRSLRVTFWNRYAEAIFGYGDEEILGRSLLETIVPRTETTGRDLHRLLEDIGADPDRYATNVNENVTKDGRRLLVAWVNRPVFDEEGTLVEVASYGIDISGYRDSAAGGGAFSEGLKRLFEPLPGALVTLDAEGLVTSWNRSAERLLGWSAQASEGIAPPFLHEMDLRVFRERCASAARCSPPGSFRCTLRKADGVLLEVTVTASFLAGGEGLLLALD